MTEIILTDKMIVDWLDEIPNMRKETNAYPTFMGLAMSVIFEILEIALNELKEFRSASKQ